MKRLTPAFLTVMMFGVVGLLVAAYVAKNLLAVEEKPPEATEDLIPMAIADLAPGTLVTTAHLGRGPWPKNRMEPDILRTDRVITGRYTRGPIKSGQPIRANDLLPPNEYPTLNVAQGMVAMSVDVSGSAAMVNGMLKPNDFVDVLFTYQGGNDDNIQGGVTMRLFEGVRVLVVSRGSSNRSDNYVTLELTEPQANVLTLARDRGAITLTYNPNGRGNGGLALTNAERVTLYEILGMKAADEPFMTEIYRGTGRSTNHFNDRGKLIESYSPPTQNNRPQQQLTPTPARPAPGGTTPVLPTDINSPDEPTSPTAVRHLPEPK